MSERPIPERAAFPPERLLLGPGPSPVHPSVLLAMSQPVVGHLDPAFAAILRETSELLRIVFQTSNELTLAISGTGSAGMEAALVNLIEPGDQAVVGVNGLFGQRMAEIARRAGAQVVPVEARWGQPLDPDDIRRALASLAPRRPALLAVVQAETSTGVEQPLAPLARLAREHDVLFLVDSVTALGGIPVEVDRHGIDMGYAGTQKCLNAPPGLAPLTVSPRARQRIAARTRSVQSWYLDLSLIQQYWGSDRLYHHTAPVSMVYALCQALRLVVEEGLEPRFARHRLHSAALSAGLEALGFEFVPPAGFRLPTLHAVRVPEAVDEAALRARLLNEFGIEVGGGLGPLKGRIWRIGLMGHGARRQTVAALLAALETLFGRPGEALRAANAVYDSPGVSGSADPPPGQTSRVTKAAEVSR